MTDGARAIQQGLRKGTYIRCRELECIMPRVSCIHRQRIAQGEDKPPGGYEGIPSYRRNIEQIMKHCKDCRQGQQVMEHWLKTHESIQRRTTWTKQTEAIPRGMNLHETVI